VSKRPRPVRLHHHNPDTGPEEDLMKYLLLIYSDPTIQMTDAESNEMMGEYFAFTHSIVESGEMLAGEPLQGRETATTVAVRDGEAIVTDGPFAETKEVLGGFYMVDTVSLERAQVLAGEIPTAKFGRVEVRPLLEIPEDYGVGGSD
jgi:hypothetical protein